MDTQIDFIKKTMKISLLCICLMALFLHSAKAQVNLSSGLIAWYPFSGNANDATGNGHNGVINHASLTTDRFGKSNSAYSTDGAKKASTIPAIGDYKATGITISMWINMTKTGSVCPLIQGEMGTFYVNLLKKGKFIAIFDRNFRNNSDTNTSKTTVTCGKWMNLTATNDGTTTRLYLNGKLEKTYPETLKTGGSDLIIGSQNFNGTIDDIRIYNRAISATEVAAIYNLTE